jgi:uncharacterized damage-inducible protein DinB
MTDTAQMADIRNTLNHSLEKARSGVVMKVTGLDDDQLRRALLPSAWSLLGLVKHLAYVERWWFRHIMAGEDVEFPVTDDDSDAEWRIEPDDTTEAILALYADECARARVVVDAFDLDEPVRHGEGMGPGTRADLALVMIHMIEETSRHAGHADAVRELIDGVTAHH